MYLNIKEIEASELAQRLAAGDNVRIVDIRQPTEISAGTVPGAQAVPLHTLPLRLSEFDRDTPLVFVCRSGARSAQACAFLQQNGFDNVYNLRGGMIGWAGSGQAIGAPAS